ncbi:MAG: enoyl-CoA hydratase/isomerase family protein [Deltaproteobacteria bacterium]|nr:enoyl-CoA hydratase/isomerase family protein [Deltaproteobacteria bacterium]
MALSELVVKHEGQIIIATIHRPEKLNALNKEVFDHLRRLLDVLETDKTARVLIFTGTGEKAFCIGGDLKERQSMNEKDILVRLESIRTLFRRIENLHVPVIAAINGIALGTGLELALTCDLRVASSNANLGFLEGELAIIPGSGGTQRLARLIGMAKALELILLAKRLTAQEALGYGVIHQMVEERHAMVQAMEWAKRFLELGPISLAQAKKALREGIGRSLEEGLNIEADAYKTCLYSTDRTEGNKAFIEKRKPQYKRE